MHGAWAWLQARDHICCCPKASSHQVSHSFVEMITFEGKKKLFIAFMQMPWKCHFSRFFPEDGHKYQKNNNALAGTVVDHGINIYPSFWKRVHDMCLLTLFRHQPSHWGRLLPAQSRRHPGYQPSLPLSGFQKISFQSQVIFVIFRCFGTTLIWQLTHWRPLLTISATSIPGGTPPICQKIDG